jgi:hypothetical protein
LGPPRRLYNDNPRPAELMTFGSSVVKKGLGCEKKTSCVLQFSEIVTVPVLKSVAKKRLVETNRLRTLVCVTVNYKSVEIVILL